MPEAQCIAVEMPAPLAVYATLYTLLWICVNAEEPASRANATAEPPDTRSALGRVPPYQPPAAGVLGPIPVPGFRPPNTRVDAWHHNSRLQPYGARVVAETLEEEGDPGCHISCSKEFFSCQDACKCIPIEKRCDGAVDCMNAEDEAGCTPSCDEHDNRTICHGTSVCIALEWLCDGDNDCGDFSDETHCGKLRAGQFLIEKRCDGSVDCMNAEDEAGSTPSCDEHDNRTICHGTRVCIALEWLCDGDNDCGDFSNETHCGGTVACSPEQFQCANGLCVHKEWVCDGDNDCRDNSDEHDCPKGKCRDNQFACASGECLALHWKCDKEEDCRDSSDEAECPVDLIRCGENEIQCNNKKCVRKDFQCDGDNDCGDWTDEDSCPIVPGSCNSAEFKCSDGKCIPDRWRCDVERDCSDGDDELNCEAHGMRNCTSDEYTCLDKRCISKTWLCDGVKDCTNGEDETNCVVKCEEDQYMCRSQLTNAFRNCVNRKHVCDGMNDCPQGDDEENCPTKRKCTHEDKCKEQCITTHDGLPACSCPLGFLLDDDGISCKDIDECMYEQDPVCSQTCSNTNGSFRCGCMTGYVLRPDGRSCKATGESPTLLFSNRVGIRQVWLTGDNYVPILKGLHNAMALDYHYEKNLVFWTENNMKVIRVAHLENNNMTDVIKWGLESPSGLAVDWIHNLLFWTDSGTRRVEVASLDGSRRAVIASSDVDRPRAIAVHPGDALVFWTDWGPNPKIERADMDGSRRKSVIVNQIFWPNGLTIDYIESKIYWADAKHHVIEKATFDGSHRERVTNKGLPHPFALTLFEDAVYWTDWHTKSISSVNKYNGMGMQTVHASAHVPMDIQSYHPLRQLRTYQNRCGRNNGGCAHLCLPNANGYSCRCPVGFNLLPDGHSCEETPEKLLLYARRKDIRLKQLHARNQMDSLDMVIPVENIKSAVALDWDHNSNSIFWTDVEKDTINRAFLNGSEERVIISSNLISPAGLAYDWLTNKLYWTDAGTNRIEVANVDGSMRTLLAWDNIDKPRDIVVDPKGGLMYWSDWGASPCIERADMDGGNRKKLLFGDMVWPNGLALDLANNRIYWTDGGNRTIEYANLDGTGRTVLIDQHLPHPFGLDLYGDEVFWTDWDGLSIQAANKYTGKNRRTLGAGVEGLMDVRVFHRERKGGSNRCSNNNGGCSHLCLLKPNGRTCACPIGIKLGKDGKTCANGPVNFLIFAHRIDIRIVSLDVPYLVDVVLPLPSLKNALGVDVDQRTGLIYWTDTGERKIQRATKDGKNIETIIGKGLHTADGLVIDSAGRKIYWTDGGRNSIEVAELDGSNRKVLVWTGLDSPRAIALHYEHGYMFWSDWGTSAKIERADMDGQNRRIIVDTNIKWPNGLAIDRIKDRLYWNDAKVLTIESSDFNGHDRQTILSQVPYPYGIVIVGQHIYWTDWKTKALHRADKTNGKDQLVIRENLEGLMDIRAIQGDQYLEGVCSKNNGGCSHLCLRSPRGYTCACPTGLLFENQTEPHPKICKKHPDNFLVFATKGSVAMISLDTPEQWDITLPLKNIQNSIAVDYHWERKLIFFTDVNNNEIRSINMENMTETKVIVNHRLDTPNGLGVDWIANNIYWTDNEFKVVEVARLDGSCRKTLISGLSEPRALALFPAKAYLYWSDWGESPNIERATLDGGNRKIIVDHDLGFPNGITIDYKDRRLYWTDALKDRIDTADLNGQHRVQLVPDAKNPFGMTQFKDYIYWTDWYKKSVMRADKRTGKNVTAIRTDLEMAMEIKAVSAEKQHGWNPCKEDNGGCSHLCLFRGHDYVCECPDVQDDKVCSKSPKLQVDLQMPPHYPSFYDYADSDVTPPPPAPTFPTHSGMSGLIILVSVFVVVIIITVVGVVCCLKMRKRTGGALKNEDYELEREGHISFHNPNYTCAAGQDERRPRFQGIFKYDRSQGRVTNVYMQEGTSLLPPPPPPPHGVTVSAPARPRNDDFEPVTLHSFA